jgi:hypothetical protein
VDNKLKEVVVDRKSGVGFIKTRWFIWLSAVLFILLIINWLDIIRILIYGKDYLGHYPYFLSVVFRAIEIILTVPIIPVILLATLFQMHQNSYSVLCLVFFLIYIFALGSLINFFLIKTSNEIKTKIKKLLKYILYGVIVLAVLFLIIFGIFHLTQSTKSITLSEGDIRIESIEYINAKSCSEIQESMKTLELAEGREYRTKIEMITWINPDYDHEKWACMVGTEGGETFDRIKQFPTGWKTGANPNRLPLSLNMNESYKIKFCCYLVNYLDNQISNEVCTTKLVEKIC